MVTFALVRPLECGRVNLHFSFNIALLNVQRSAILKDCPLDGQWPTGGD
jgi:hypothetical protein